MTRSAFDSLLCLLALALIGGSVAAQVPEHVAVVGTTAIQGSRSPGTSGVFYVTLPTSKVPGGLIFPLKPLPPRLTVKNGGSFGGAYSLVRRPSDDTLFVGDGAGSGAWCHVHILKVKGPVVVNSRSVRVGQVINAPRNSRIVKLALLPDGRVLIAAGPFVSGPMAPSLFAILDDRPTTPTVTPILLSQQMAARFIYAVAVSPDGKTAYVTNQRSLSNPGPARLYSIDITQSRPAPVLLHTWPNHTVPSLEPAGAGRFFATCFDPASSTSPSIEEIRIVGNKAVVKGTPLSIKTAAADIALERATGRFALVSTDFGVHVAKNSVFLGDRNGKLSRLTGPPPGGWGVPIAIDINNAFETYGTATSGANRYSFAEFPNPGGLPEVGNAGFSLTVNSAPGVPTSSFLLLGIGRTDLPVAGVRMLVDPRQALVVFPLPAAPSVRFPMPIPNDLILRDRPLYTQSVHTEAARPLATSNGLSISIR